MAHSARRVALAAIMALVVLLFSGCAHLGRAIVDEDMELPIYVEMPAIPRVEGLASYEFTAAQKTNTLKMLQAFSAAMPELKSIWTGSSFCDWNGITCYGSAAYINLASIEVSGSLPEVPADVDGKNVMIDTVNLYNKKTALTGTLPASWGKLTNLVTVNLGSTSVSGTLPVEWWTLDKLSFLSMPNTQVSGTLPAEWLGMASLSTLTLYSTQVSGTLPPQWEVLASLSILQLQKCKLAGSLPDSWSKMPKLTRMALTGNDFCGCVPQSWKDSTTMRVAIEAKHSKSTCVDIICYITTTTTTTTTTEKPTTSTTTTTTEKPTTSTTTTTTEKPTTSTTTTTTTTEKPTTTTTTTPRPSTPQPASFAKFFKSLCNLTNERTDAQINANKKYICCSDYNITGDTWKCGEDIRGMLDATVNCSAPKADKNFKCCANVDEYGNRDYIGGTCNASRGMVSALMAVAAVLAVVMSSVM